VLENCTGNRLREIRIIPCARKPLKVGDYNHDYEATVVAAPLKPIVGTAVYLDALKMVLTRPDI